MEGNIVRHRKVSKQKNSYTGQFLNEILNSNNKIKNAKLFNCDIKNYESILQSLSKTVHISAVLAVLLFVGPI